MFCAQCGTANPDGVAFCSNCGAPLNAGQADTNQSAPQYVQTPDMNQSAPQNVQTPDMNQSAPQYIQQPDAMGNMQNGTYYQQPYNNGFAAPMIKKRKMNLAAIIASAITLISVFLPFYTVEFWGYKESVSLVEGVGAFIVVLSIASIVLGVLGINLPIAIIGGLDLLLVLITIGNVNSEMGKSAGLIEDLITKGAGYYLVLIGSIAVCVAGIVMMVLNKNTQNQQQF